MKKILRSILYSFMLCTTAFAESTHHVTLVNHNTIELHFIVGKNPETLPDFSKNFTLDTGARISSTVLPEHPQAYLRAEDSALNNGFFGVGIENGNIAIHGYVSKGLAYSWQNDIVTFCTPAEHQRNGHC